MPKSAAGADAPKPSLPPSIANALPTAVAVMQHMAAVDKLLPNLSREMLAAEAGGAVGLARSFVALHRMMGRIDDILKPAVTLFDLYKKERMPQVFEQSGVPNVSLDEGFRVGLSHRFFASILPDKRDQAYAWMRKNGMGDLIAATVNSQTLSAAAKALSEEHNKDLPSEFFTVAMVPNTSVTVTK